MGHKSRAFDYTVAVIALAIPLVVLRSSTRDERDLSRVDVAILTVSSPLQRGATWIVEGVGGLWNRYLWLVDVEEENRELRLENSRLHRELQRATTRAADTEVLSKLLELRTDSGADTVSARVVGSSISAGFRIMRVVLEHGEAAIEAGMPVVAARGLVGRIQAHYGSYAEVLLTSDPRSSVEVFLPRTAAVGRLRGSGDDNSYACEIDRIENRADVQVGDEVVTSGLGRIPAGIPVGRVTQLIDPGQDLFQTIEVTPSVEVTRVRSVLIVLAPPPASTTPSPENSGPAPSAYGARAL